MEALTPGTKRFLRALFMSSLHPRKGETEPREGKGLVRAPSVARHRAGKTAGAWTRPRA